MNDRHEEERIFSHCGLCESTESDDGYLTYTSSILSTQLLVWHANNMGITETNTKKLHDAYI